MRKHSLLLLFLGFLSACIGERLPPLSTAVTIHAVLYDGYELANDDELIAIQNISQEPVEISGWQVTDNDSGTAVFPPNTILTPNQIIWLTKNGTATSRQYRLVSDFEIEDSHTMIASLLGEWPGLRDSGDELILLDPYNRIVDMVVFKGGNTDYLSWQGTAVQPTFVEEEGIFLQRTAPTDTHTAADWEQVISIEKNGRAIGSPNRIGANLTRK